MICILLSTLIKGKVLDDPSFQNFIRTGVGCQKLWGEAGLREGSLRQVRGKPGMTSEVPRSRAVGHLIFKKLSSPLMGED